MKQAIFAGLTTLDFIYRLNRLPVCDEKMVAKEAFVAAGGPAANAAIAFQHLGGRSRLVTALGSSNLSQLVIDDIRVLIAEIIDLAAGEPRSPSVSSIFVLPNGTRTVISLNAQVNPLDSSKYYQSLLDACDCVMVDGHHMGFCQALAFDARRRGIPVIVDGGSWKDGSSELFTAVDIAICSADFLPPGCTDSKDVLLWLQSMGIQKMAITDGAKSIVAWEEGFLFNVKPPRVDALDTTAAGDIFHGAFCYFWQNPCNFQEALHRAADVAAMKCSLWGTRSWMRRNPTQEFQ